MGMKQELPVVQTTKESSPGNDRTGAVSWAISFDNKLVAFTCSGDEDTVRKHVRELLVLTRSPKIKPEFKQSSGDNNPKNFAQYNIYINMNDNDKLAEVFWFIGKSSGNHFHSPENFRSDYQDTMVYPDDLQTPDKPCSETLGCSLARAIEKAIARKEEPLVMKVNTLPTFRRYAHAHPIDRWAGLMTNGEMKAMEDFIAKSAAANIQNMQQPEKKDDSITCSIRRFFGSAAASIGQFFSPAASENSRLTASSDAANRHTPAS